MEKQGLYVPKETKVMSGYLLPSKLEKMTCERFENNEFCRPVLEYGGKKFILKYDDNKGISGVPFEIKEK